MKQIHEITQKKKNSTSKDLCWLILKYSICVNRFSMCVVWLYGVCVCYVSSDCKCDVLEY
jgi:hypothetical protein